MKRFIVLAVFALALTLMLSGTAMAYTDYIPYLSKGVTGAVGEGLASGDGSIDSPETDAYGTTQNVAPRGMPNTADAYALGCFYCHGFEKRSEPNNTDTVDVTRVLTAPNVEPLVEAVLVAVGAPTDTPLIVDPLADGKFYDSSDTAGLGTFSLGDLLDPAPHTGAGLPVSNSRWTNLAMQYGQPYGPHGGYSNTTDRCKVCHDVHAAAGSKRLTAGNTAEDICETCHDFTQGISIYGAIKEATGVDPDGGHRIQDLWDANQSTETPNANPALDAAAIINDAADDGLRNPDSLSVDADRDVAGAQEISSTDANNDGRWNTSGTLIPGYIIGPDPGYDNQTGLNYPQTGGVYTYTSASLASRESRLTCTDCHTPHGNTSMRPFKSDRVRLGSSILVAALLIQPTHITWTQDLSALIPGAPASADASGMALGGSAPGWLPIDPNTDMGAMYAARGITEIQPSGVALALTLNGVGILDLDIGPDGLRRAALTRVASNKLLRDYINELDLRDPIYGGVAPGTDVDYNDYNSDWEAPFILGAIPGTGADVSSATVPGAPWNNGQLGAEAIYGSGFCASCHRGRIGNYVGLVNDERYSASRGAARLDQDFLNIDLPPNADGAYTPGFGYVDSSTVWPVPNTFSDEDTCYNHPTLMKVAYNGVGTLDWSATGGYPGGGAAAPIDTRGSHGFPGSYIPIMNDGLSTTDTPGFGESNGHPGATPIGAPDPFPRGLAMSNQGFVMWPADRGNHPDGRIGDSERERPKAPICQQCHEDSREVEAAFSMGDTDKNVPFDYVVNLVLGLDGSTPTPYGTPTQDNNGDGELSGSQIPFIYDGNPAFANFPHETQNYRLLVEGGDSNYGGNFLAGLYETQGGGANDDLCLNCHVPGSSVRPGDPDAPIIFNSLVKDFNGFQE